jgi:hypothetical protein
MIDIIIAAAKQMPSDECEIFTAQLGGAASRAAPDSMAYPHRSVSYTTNIHGRWQSTDLDDSGTKWVRNLFTFLEAHSTGSVYVNFVLENGKQRKIGPYGDNLARLQQIKRQVAPKNLFKTNINILPR